MSVVHTSRKKLQELGECVKLANVDWFAIYPNKLAKILTENSGANLVLYRTKSTSPRDHYVIPLKAMQHMLTEESLGDMSNGGKRWNLAIKGDDIRVTNTGERINIAPYFGLPLKTERAESYTDFQIPEEEDAVYSEGRTSKIIVNRYERDPKARKSCILINGCSCVVCGMNFLNVYGNVAEGYIHVHHLKPISSLGLEYKVDPEKDLVPLCPNCHSVAHMRKPPFSVEEIKAMIKSK